MHDDFCVVKRLVNIIKVDKEKQRSNNRPLWYAIEYRIWVWLSLIWFGFDRIGKWEEPDKWFPAYLAKVHETFVMVLWLLLSSESSMYDSPKSFWLQGTFIIPVVHNVKLLFCRIIISNSIKRGALAHVCVNFFCPHRSLTIIGLKFTFTNRTSVDVNPGLTW